MGGGRVLDDQGSEEGRGRGNGRRGRRETHHVLVAWEEAGDAIWNNS